MKQIAKATVYRIKKSKEFRYAYIISIIISAAFLITSFLLENDGEELRGTIDNITFFYLIINMFFVCVCMGNDFKSKILYYEVMYGHSRAKIFFGRLIGILIYSAIMSITQIIMFLLLAIYFNNVLLIGDCGEIVIKCFMWLILYLSYSVLSFALTFISKSTIGGLGLSWIIMIIGNSFLLFDNIGVTIGSQPLSTYFGLFVFRHMLMEPITGGMLLLVLGYLLFDVILMTLGIKHYNKADLT